MNKQQIAQKLQEIHCYFDKYGQKNIEDYPKENMCSHAQAIYAMAEFVHNSLEWKK